jgi:hypothetical protein
VRSFAIAKQTSRRNLVHLEGLYTAVNWSRKSKVCFTPRRHLSDHVVPQNRERPSGSGKALNNRGICQPAFANVRILRRTLVPVNRDFELKIFHVNAHVRVSLRCLVPVSSLYPVDAVSHNILHKQGAVIVKPDPHRYLKSWSALTIHPESEAKWSPNFSS